MGEEPLRCCYWFESGDYCDLPDGHAEPHARTPELPPLALMVHDYARMVHEYAEALIEIAVEFRDSYDGPWCWHLRSSALRRLQDVVPRPACPPGLGGRVTTFMPVCEASGCMATLPQRYVKRAEDAFDPACCGRNSGRAARWCTLGPGKESGRGQDEHRVDRP